MFKFLQRIFGKSSSSYESLLKNRDQKATFSEEDVSKIIEVLQPVTQESYQLFRSQKTASQPYMPSGNKWPVNVKGEPLIFQGGLMVEDYLVNIFIHENGFKKDDSNLQIFLFSKEEIDSLEVLDGNSKLLSPQSYSKKIRSSLPIWEEVIHRFPGIHKLIVKIAPQHPWTLYKQAKAKVCSDMVKEQIGGYPQWLVNDVDYRKIKDTTFILQLQDMDSEEIVYIFQSDQDFSRFQQKY